MAGYYARIPDNLMRPMTHISHGEGYYDADHGGQWVDGTETRTPFRGALLPMSEKDLQKAPVGTYTADSRKVYTNRYAIRVGETIQTESGELYEVKMDLDHGQIHPMRRYIVERAGRAHA